MSDCCHVDYRKVFRTSQGLRDLKAYQRRGLSGTEADLAGLVRGLGVSDASLIDIGAGIGQLHVDLLSDTATSATSVDISAGWDEAAEKLLQASHLTDRVTRVVGDFVEEVDGIEPADAVMLHRVICCYRDWHGLVDASADHARRAVVFTVPRETFLSRLGLWAFNAFLAVQRCGFRSYLHPVSKILARYRERGFEVTGKKSTYAWVTYRVERTAA